MYQKNYASVFYEKCNIHLLQEMFLIKRSKNTLLPSRQESESKKGPNKIFSHGTFLDPLAYKKIRKKNRFYCIVEK